MILEHLFYHHACSLKSWPGDHANILPLDFLHAYSPKLNPIESIWKLARRIITHNQYFLSVEDLDRTVEKQFKVSAIPNEMLRRLCLID